MKFYLMNKDNKIALLEVDVSHAEIVELYSNIPLIACDTWEWINRRIGTSSRANIQMILASNSMTGADEYLAKTHGVSLIDTFWFKSISEDTAWSEVSPYQNKISKDVSNASIYGTDNYTNLDVSIAPEFKLDGSVPKCWNKVNGEIRLLKSNGECWSGVAGPRPYMEYYASQVAEQLISDKSHFVKYNIAVGHTEDGLRKPTVYCNSFTDEDTGLIQYELSKYKGTSLSELDKTILKHRDRIILREMLLLDSIIMNYDRHRLNYGFLIDNNTLKTKGLAPIYDNDCSMGHYISLQNVDSKDEFYQEALKNQPRTEMGDYIQQAQWAMTDRLYNNLRNMYPFTFVSLPDKDNVDPERISHMTYIINRQIRAILTSIKR